MKIAFAASEAAPFIKTGGLGDVAQALPLALSKIPGVEVLLFLPYYGKMKREGSFSAELIEEFELSLSWRRQYVGLYRVRSRKRKLKVFLIDNEYYFDREPIYGALDDGERFAFFSKAILECLCRLGEKPDIIHANDWQTALIPCLLHGFYEESLGSAKTVFSIHNIEYQGWVHPYFLGDVLGLGTEYDDVFRFDGSHNLMKSAVLCCDALTTVSRTYARQIMEPYFAHGLDGVMRDHSFKISGIVNGIDFASNDPMTDPGLPVPYGPENALEGKRAAKAALQKELGLAPDPDVPLIGMVSRLVSHKGLEILVPALEELMDWNVQIAIVGTGDRDFEEALSALAARHPKRFCASICFSRALGSRIYAAADLYLMPSKSEPCGLSQMIAMHYGTVPVVHETGGLKDTVTPFDPETGEGLGFSFSRFTKEDLLDALRRALHVYGGLPEAWKRVVHNGMTADFSWDSPAKEYLSLYENLLS
ncbi:MAG: glycogen synthase [Clostridia bacterium]|nr:glycogen synthase [Clostridia bacterium]